jgi:hypothetical protein
MMSVNTLPFLHSVIERLAHAHIEVWLFGGWAEELWQMIPPRSHADIDLLFRASSFEALDTVLAADSAWIPISQKYFSHKRAVHYQQVMIEFLLAQGSPEASTTTFFDKRYQLEWPADTFTQTLNVGVQKVAIASQSALIHYRQQHHLVEQAYRDWVLTNALHIAPGTK